MHLRPMTRTSIFCTTIVTDYNLLGISYTGGKDDMELYEDVDQKCLYKKVQKVLDLLFKICRKSGSLVNTVVRLEGHSVATDMVHRR